MSDQFVIDDASLESAGQCLVTASRTMSKYSARAPAQFASLTGIGATVHQYLMNAREGRLALADAAKTGSTQVAGIMDDSKALDSHIANSLQAGFVVKGAKQ